MTTTITIKARALGATACLKTEGSEEQTFFISAHQDLDFHISANQSMTVTEGLPVKLEEVETKTEEDPAPATPAVPKKKSDTL